VYSIIYDTACAGQGQCAVSLALLCRSCHPVPTHTGNGERGMARKATEMRGLLLRLPEGLRRRLEREGERNARSMNSEIIHRLEGSFRTANENLLRVILNATIGGAPEWVTPEHGREIRFSPSVKATMIQRITAFIASLPEAAESTLSAEEVDELSRMVEAA